MTGPRRTVGVFTAARSDLTPLGSVIAALSAHPQVRLTVIATGGHLDPSRGNTLADIDVATDELEIIDSALPDAAPTTLVGALGPVSAGVADVLSRRGIETLVVLGDRWEIVAAASAAVLCGVALAHLHGGEITSGALDDRIRHATTKLADLHCCANEDSARRLRQLGEDPARVIVTGAPGLDRHRHRCGHDPDALAELLGTPVQRPLGVVTYHPETVDRGSVRARARLVLDTAAAALGTAIVTYPGIDSGADEVIGAITEAAAGHPNIVVVPHLGARFTAVLAAADVMVGNSSSGIWEAATFELPVVDVGERQSGRLRPANVLHADHDASAIAEAIAAALAPGFRAGLAGMTNPYGDGRAADRIVEAILALPSERPLPKTFVDLP